MDSEAIAQHFRDPKSKAEAEAAYFTVWGRRNAMATETQKSPQSVVPADTGHDSVVLKSRFEDVFGFIREHVLVDKPESLDDLAHLIARAHLSFIQTPDNKKTANRDAAEIDVIIGCITNMLAIGEQERLIYAGLCRQLIVQKGENPAL